MLLIVVWLSFLIINEAFFSALPAQSTFLLRMVAETTPLVSKAGKRFEAKPGSPLGPAVSKLGLRVPYSCKKGDCGTCTVTVAGKKIRACVGKVPPAPKLKSLKEKGLITTVDN